MTFTPKNYTIGDVLYSADLNEMDANDDHVREESSYHLIVSAARVDLGTEAPTVKIDGSTSIVLIGAGAERTASDIWIGNLALGLHTIDIFGSAPAPAARWRFYKTPDLDYLSVWVKFSSSSGGGVATYWTEFVTVLGHREMKYLS